MEKTAPSCDPLTPANSSSSNHSLEIKNTKKHFYLKEKLDLLTNNNEAVFPLLVVMC